MNPIKFSRKTLPQKEGLGDKLAKKRVALGLTTQDVGKAIRIRPNFIEDIEGGRYENLPPEVFVKGFLKTYAEFLKLDPEKVVKIYQKERGLVENIKKKSQPPVLKPQLKVPKFIITPKSVFFILIAMVVLVITGYIGWQVKILTAAPKLNITNPADNITVETDSILVEGNTDPGATLTINEVGVGISQAGEFQEKITLQNGVNTLKIRSQNKLGRYKELTRVVVAEIKSTIPNITVMSGIELKVTVGPESASLLVEIDGVKVTDKPVIVLPGVTQTYKASDKIVLSTDNAGSIRLTYNGEDIGVLGDDGEKIEKDFVKGEEIN